MSPQEEAGRLAAWLEEAWLARYLDRQLTADEANWFEAYVLDKPDLLQSIEGDLQLRDALARTPDLTLISRETGNASTNRAHPVRWARHSRWLAMAASLVAALGLGGFVGHRVVQSVRIENPPVVMLDSYRGPDNQALGRLESGGDPNSSILLIAIPIPANCKINKAKLLSGDTSQDIPTPNLTSDRFAWYAITRPAEKRARIELEATPTSCISSPLYINGSH